MNSQDVKSLFDGIERFKANIKECDEILIILREIQKDYANAVARPRELIEKLDVLSEKFNENFSSVSEQQLACSADIKKLITYVKDEYVAILAELRISFSDYIAQDKENHVEIMSKCSSLIERFEQSQKELKGVIEELNEQLRNVIRQVAESKRFSLISMCLGAFASVITLVILILQFV